MIDWIALSIVFIVFSWVVVKDNKKPIIKK
jgi:hypothetical protein